MTETQSETIPSGDFNDNTSVFELMRYKLKLKNMATMLAHHGEKERLFEWLNSFQTLQNKLNEFGVMDLISDFNLEFAQQHEELKLIQRALLQSAHVLQVDKSQLAGQLIGRLLDLEGKSSLVEEKKPRILPRSLFMMFAPQKQSISLPPKYPGIHQLLLVAKRWNTRTPWLRPLTNCLTPPTTPLVRMILTGYENWTNSAALTPDGKRVFAKFGKNGDVIKAWDLSSGQEIFQLNAQLELARIVVSPDGKTLLAAAWKCIQVWDLSSRIKSFDVEDTDDVQDIAFTPDGQCFVYVTQKVVMVMSVKNGAQSSTFKMPDHASYGLKLTVTPDSKYVVVAGFEDHKIHIWDLTGKDIGFHSELGGPDLHRSDHTERVSSILATPDGKKVISAASDGTIKIWDPYTRWCVKTIEVNNSANRLIRIWGITHDGKKLISQDIGLLDVWDLEKYTKEYQIALPSIQDFGSLIILPNDQEIIIAGRDLQIIRLDHSPVVTLKKQDLNTHYTISQNGNTGIVYDKTGKIHVWDFSTLEEKTAIDIGEDTFIMLSNDGKQGIVNHRNSRSGAGNSFRIIDLNNGRTIRNFRCDDGQMYGVFLSSKSKWLVTHDFDSRGFESGKTCLTVRNYSSGKELFTIQSFRNKCFNLFGTSNRDRITISMDEKYLAFAAIENPSLSKMDHELSEDDFIERFSQKLLGTAVIKIWNLETGKEYLTLRGHFDKIKALIFDPRGRWLISNSEDNTIRLWDYINGKEIFKFQSVTRMVTMKLAPNGNTLLTGNFDGSIIVYDLENRSMVLTRLDHRELVSSLAFNPSGNRFATGSYDKKIIVWDAIDFKPIASFDLDATVGRCQFVNDGCTIYVQDRHSNVWKFLNIENDPL